MKTTLSIVVCHMGPGFDCLLVLLDRTSSQQCLVMMFLLIKTTKGFVSTLAQAEMEKLIPPSLQISLWAKLTCVGGHFCFEARDPQ